MDTKEINKILNFVSPTLRKYLANLDDNVWDKVQEIRLTMGKSLIVCFNEGHIELPVLCDETSIKETLLLLTDNSVYAANDKLTSGFLTVNGGYRAGICGTIVMNNGNVTAIRNISSINLRIKREIIGSAEKVIQYIKHDNKIHNTLIISPPKRGKTTLLRDIARMLGNTHNVSIVDERSEIAGMYEGMPQNDIGIQSTVLDACLKSIGIPMVIRSMSPDVIVTDEIGSNNDAEAIEYAAKSGVRIIASAHGKSLKDLEQKPTLRKILKSFEIFIILSDVGEVGTVKEIISGERQYV